MFNVLIDTCVWLDLAQDPKQTPLLLVVENMAEDKALSLIVPRVVHDEFHRNRERVAKASARSLASHFQQVKEAVKKGTADRRRQRALLTQLDDLNHKIPLIGGAAEGVLERIGKLFQKAAILETSDAAKLRAADRALNRRAPCHRENKNSMADAIVIESQGTCVGAPPLNRNVMRVAFGCSEHLIRYERHTGILMSASLKSLGIDRLSVEERLALVEELWDSIAEDSAAVPLTDAQRTELDRRLAEHEAHPDDVVSWEDVKASITARLKR